jgi:hypothetical protein
MSLDEAEMGEACNERGKDERDEQYARSGKNHTEGKELAADNRPRPAILINTSCSER